MPKIIEIFKEDCLGYVYFITGLARDTMHSGLSSKSDLMGGIFDRFINIIPEGIIFDKYFLPKINNDYRYIGDFYRYKPVSEGIAPDLLGVKANDVDIPFAKFGSRGWRKYKNAPEIEVKTFKKNQYMVSLRNQNYDDKYLIMLEFDLKPDYLSPFFLDDLFEDNIHKSLIMNDDTFIEKGIEQTLEQPPIISKDNKLGDLELIKVVKANKFMEICDLCGPGQSPRYLKEIEETRTTKSFELDGRRHRRLSQYFTLDKKLYRYNGRRNNWFNERGIITLGLDIENVNNIRVVKNSKSTLTIYTTDEVTINRIKLNKNKTYIIRFGILPREGSTTDEYFMNKGAIVANDDYEEEMISMIDKHINEIMNEKVEK